LRRPVSARPTAGRVAWLGVALAAGGAWQALLILALLAAVLWADEIAQAVEKALSPVLLAACARVRQRRELRAALARQGQALPAQMRCAHERTEDVPDLTGTLVARLCLVCEAQLPPGFEALKGNR
jgi:hypothetical protein